MNQPDVGKLSLYFEPPISTGPDLQQQLLQVIKQRGALRHITKQSLQAEIDQPRALASRQEGGDVSSEDEDEHDEPQARQQRLWKAREEMLQKLAYAQNEVLSALDFVSLLLSSSSSTAHTSMSPALKERVPVGSVDGKSIEKQDVSNAYRQKLSKVSDGWKAENFRSASNTFSQAATRLENEAQRQSKYWEQIGRLKSQGWSISRLPADTRAVGIHYGSPDAGPQYRHRSFALLQQDDMGNLQLDPRSIPENSPTTQIAIVRDGIRTGLSRAHLEHKEHENDICTQIERARDAMFEEELFNEISREARSIANQGARTQPKAVEAQIDSHTQIHIIQTTEDESQRSLKDGPDNQLAESIALTLRLLLLLEHTKTKQRRSQPPPMMSLTSSPPPENALLRPVLTYIRHHALLTTLRKACTSIEDICVTAGLSFTFRMTGLVNHETSIAQLCQPARTDLTVELNNGRNIEIEIETNLGQPTYGPVFRSTSLDFGFVNYQAGTFSTISEIIEYLTHALMLELISQSPELTVLRPHSGDVMLKSSDRITGVISFRPQRLQLQLATPSKVAYIWRSKSFQRIPADSSRTSQSFRGVIQALDAGSKQYL